jgi:hypothetical protein
VKEDQQWSEGRPTLELRKTNSGVKEDQQWSEGRPTA